MAQVDDLGVALQADVEVVEELSMTVVEELLGHDRVLLTVGRRRGVERDVADLLVAACIGWQIALERALETDLNLFGDLALIVWARLRSLCAVNLFLLDELGLLGQLLIRSGSAFARRLLYRGAAELAGEIRIGLLVREGQLGFRAYLWVDCTQVHLL